MLLKVPGICLIILKRKAKEKLSDVDYKKSRYRRRRINDDEDDALENLEPRDKFRIKIFIPVMDALEQGSGTFFLREPCTPHILKSNSVRAIHYV